MLEGKVAIITGGTRGIGYDIVKKFLDNKAKVVLFGSREESVNKAINNLKEEGYEAIGFYPNLSNLDDVKEAYDEVIKAYGKIDVLVNNAGVSSATPFEKYTEEEYEKFVDQTVNLIYEKIKRIK